MKLLKMFWIRIIDKEFSQKDASVFIKYVPFIYCQLYQIYFTF